jgi:hypothetical protein
VNKDWIVRVRVFRSDGAGGLQVVSDLAAPELSFESVPPLGWGDLVEVQYASGGSSPSEGGILINDCLGLIKDRTVVTQIGPWRGERVIDAGRATLRAWRTTDHELFQQDPAWVHDPRVVTLRRGDAEPMRIDLANPVEVPAIRLVDGDVIEMGMSPNFREGKEWSEFVHVWQPDDPCVRQMLGAVNHKTLFTGLEALKWASGRDYGKLELHRRVDGKEEVQKLDLLKRIAEAPRENWANLKLNEFFGDEMRAGDLLIVPKLERAAGETEEAMMGRNNLLWDLLSLTKDLGYRSRIK